MKTLPGSAYPLGATWDNCGVNFAIYSANAERVELCLFADDGTETRVNISHRTAFVWHICLPGVAVGQRYGFRVHGPYAPEAGHRFNPNVVVLDPYARAVDGVERWDYGCFAYEMGHPDADLAANTAPALGAPRGVVIDPSFDWEGDENPRTPLRRSVIYEAHVKGLTQLHPDIPENMRGTYLGIAHPATIAYLKELGITTLELMPIHAFVDDKHLLDRNLRNYWGYNSIGFFAPDVRYRSTAELGAEVREFKQMVKALHRAGLEVILDVVYNHTAEGNHLGPTLSFKGIDNATYYRLVTNNPRYYFDYTGTGNTLNVRSPQVLALIMDSLRYWASEMHVDGFRFDLASSLARELHEVNQLSSFFTLIHQSPTLRNVKLIAEPWDVGDDGYQVGRFPVLWAEWNGRYRDTLRSFWRGDRGLIGDLGYRLSGSSDLYASGGRVPAASINFVTAHDGFTLRDLVSYNGKHNEANGEDNRDGSDNERSFNYGVEGETHEAAINAVRQRQHRNLLATLFLAQGTPMLLSGDEFGRSQRGNNNAYCQDNELTWLSWTRTPRERALFEFTKRLIHIRREHPSLRRSKFFQGLDVAGTKLRDLLWFSCTGKPMRQADWEDPEVHTLQMFLAGRGIDDVDDDGRPLVDDNLLLLINASEGDVSFHIPEFDSVREPWEILIDTSDDTPRARLDPGEHQVALPGRSLLLLKANSKVVRHSGALHRLGASYRLQLNSAFKLSDARELVPYLSELGITDLYTSPLLAAAKGSTHGYDVVDHTRLNPELGGEGDLNALSDALRAQGMGLLLDWVPNHMGVAVGQNRYWDDVLENGPSSLYADYFDIDWRPARKDLRNRVLLPILGEQYGTELEQGKLRIVRNAGLCRLAYYERLLPLGPKTLVPLYELTLSRLTLDEGDACRQELESIVFALKHLPDRHETSLERKRERAREKEVMERRLARLLNECPELCERLDQCIARINGCAGAPTSFDILDGILEEQSYRLCYWKVASEEVNYRRFFDINELAALRMEDPTVFEQAHALLFKLINAGQVNALRLDHTDGLYDPYDYFEKLQSRFHRPQGKEPASPDDVSRPLPILVEKILQRDEALPQEWPVDGTTGYEFGVSIRGLWLDPKAQPALNRTYIDFTSDLRSFSDHEYECKRYIVRFVLISEVNLLAQSAHRIAIRERHFRDFTLLGLTRALTEIICAFPVYRTYQREKSEMNEGARRMLRAVIRLARLRNPALSASVFAFFESLLSMAQEGSEDQRRENTAFALRFQQLTGPIMAKAVEDTAFYRYTRLLSLNEVGGAPGKFGTTLREFHRENNERSRTWPLTMTTTATHDSKRGEDAAARIAVLSEVPELWERSVQRWRLMATSARGLVADAPAPAPAQEYLFYQALIGAVPFGAQRADISALDGRLSGFMQKVIREAKSETSWLMPNLEYEEAVATFVHNMLSEPVFLDDVLRFCREIEGPAALNALGQTLLRCCAPGVPDTYQGGELWNQSFVDPDNRRPVDYALRRRILGEIRAKCDNRMSLATELLDTYPDGRLKLYLLHVALQTRRRLPELFARGDYAALEGGEHVVAFTRSFESERLVCCVPRLTRRLGASLGRIALRDPWQGKTLSGLEPGHYLNVLTDEHLELEAQADLTRVFANFPFALLLKENSC